jgi:hypothetical protein
MKYTKFALAAVCIAQLSLISCRKQPSIAEEMGATQTSKFTSITPSQNFKWVTNNVIQVQLSAVKNDTRKSVLKIVDAEGRVYLKKFHSANEAFKASIEVPSHIKNLKVVFGGVQKDFVACTNKVVIDLK